MCVCVCRKGVFLCLHLLLSGSWGPFTEIPGPTEDRAGSRPRVRGSSWAIVSSSRHPISRLPSVRLPGSPHAGPVRGLELGPRPGRKTTALPGSRVRVGGPRVAHVVPLSSFSAGRSISNPAPIQLAPDKARVLWGRHPPWGSFAGTFASRCHHAGGLGKWAVPGCWKSCALQAPSCGEHVWAAAAPPAHFFFRPSFVLFLNRAPSRSCLYCSCRWLAILSDPYHVSFVSGKRHSFELRLARSRCTYSHAV